MKSTNEGGGRRRWPLSYHDNLALLAGLMMTTGLPPFPGTGVLALLALALLLHVLLVGERPGRAGWIFGLAHQTSLLYWLFFLDPSKSIPTIWLVPAQAIATILYVAVYYLLAGAVLGFVRRRAGGAMMLALAPAVWTGMEALRAGGEMGYPWCLTGAAWIGTPIMSLAAACGELGLGLATVFGAAALTAVTTRAAAAGDGRRRWRIALVVGAVVCWGLLGLGASLRAGDDDAPQVPPLRVAAVQADVALKDKWQPGLIDSTRVPYTELTKAAVAEGAEFVVWAETAVPAYLMFDVELLNWVRHTAAGPGIHLYTGYPDAHRLADGSMAKYNSSGLFLPTGTVIDGYAKHHLLPIGERMPFSDYLPFLAKLDLGQAEWRPGERPAPMTVSAREGDFVFAGLICFESIFSDLPRRAVADGAQCLVNITNDGWFGDTAGPRQHAALSRLRAVECGVPLLRCANNGISMIVTPDGEVAASLGIGRRGFLLHDLQRGAGGTLYVRQGYRPLALGLVVWLLVAVPLARRPKED